ncbi:MAG: T9SS type A sorting domain-containing protein [Acidimicrobiia bacterium]|nr:T9SS type A sorting domain-containing protein [Acidimicrobiia bacterium]
MLPLSVSAEPQCGTFELVPTPNPGSSSNALVDIAAVGDGTAWAVGSKTGAGTTCLILFYDGTQWSEIAVPTEAEGIAIGAIGSTPEGDVWMVGTRSYSVYQVEVFYLRARNGAIDRVDSFLNGGGPLDISASAADNVWGVSGGIWPVDAGGYVHHFDGSDFTTTQLPATFIYRNDPQGIYAAGPDDIWVAGYGGDGRAEYKGYVQHWDGSSWETVPTPFDGQNLTYFLSIDGSSSDDIWIAGHINHSEDLLLHWDGSSWTQNAGPASGASLSHVAAPGPGNSWAAPYSLSPGSPFIYWDGTDWIDGGVPNVPGAVTVNWRGLSSAGSCEVWAAGSYHDGATHQTLVARLSSGGAVATGVGEGAPIAPVLLGNHPNPFNPSTVISFELATRQNVDVRVYSIEGRLVRTLLADQLGAGAHRVEWNGRDDDGRMATSGTYLYHLRHSAGTMSGKMTLAK